MPQRQGAGWGNTPGSGLVRFGFELVIAVFHHRLARFVVVVRKCDALALPIERAVLEIAVVFVVCPEAGVSTMLCSPV
ncbi:hypothetical protein SADO_16638 [Salinisphaera dokdonensis CL-ES53]|uniref:Uncharacterized protein n=1 Tax=Salinisphaera dokdonensis CL-ES53 TaxID=1304272 RepID=A0ABV2B4S1_9GAMM